MNIRELTRIKVILSISAILFSSGCCDCSHQQRDGCSDDNSRRDAGSLADSGCLEESNPDIVSFMCPDRPDDMTDEDHTAIACGGTCLPATCSGGACTPELFIEIPQGPTALALDTEYLYFSSQDHVIRRVSLDGQGHEDLTTTTGDVHALARFGDRLYWTFMPVVNTLSYGEIASMRLPDGPVVVLAKGGRPKGISATANRIIWADYESGLRTIAHSNGVPTGNSYAFGGSINAAGMWIVGDTLFWTQMNGDNSIHSRSIQNDSTEALLVCNQKWPESITADDNQIYWINHDFSAATGKVMALARTGGNPKVMADDRSKPSAITSNSEEIFWIEQTSKIMRMAK